MHAELPSLYKYKAGTKQPGWTCSESRAPGKWLMTEAETLQSLSTGPVQTCMARDSCVQGAVVEASGGVRGAAGAG